MHFTMSALYKILLSTIFRRLHFTHAAVLALIALSTLLAKQAGHKAEMRTISQFDGYQTYRTH